MHRGDAGAGPFMLTLCRLVEPVSIRPPQSPHLKPFTFFTSRAPQPQGGAQLHLHMGFFDTLAQAERWARAVRGRHPDAIATIAPPAFWLLSAADEPAWRAPDAREGSPDGKSFARGEDQCLTDTQVLNILENRHPGSGRSDADEPGSDQIQLLRPEDTGTRRALKEAVIQGAPISFAVQLQWSARPIDPSGAPALPAFEAYTLYTVESRRPSRSCFFLRLGFFGDPVSAKQAAFHVRSSFASAAVVPVLEEEITRAREACADGSSIPCLVQRRPDRTPDSTGSTDLHRSASPSAETLEQTLARLAEREIWSDPGLLSDTGVRHLKVEVQGRAAGARLARLASRR